MVDISREVLSLAPNFARARGGNPLADPRVRVIVDDGRHHLLVRPQRYDVITAEPPPPNHAGVVNLYSREFYRLARSRLTPGGVITQWLPVFELSDGEVRAMIAAFVAELEHTALLYGYREHLILIGSPSPLAIDAARARRAGDDPGVVHNLQTSGIGDVDDVIASVVATDAQLPADGPWLPALVLRAPIIAAIQRAEWWSRAAAGVGLPLATGEVAPEGIASTGWPSVLAVSANLPR